ncbi:MAG: hypothetical protein ACE5GW_02380 [Planctomycetota bacterium]
MNVDRASIERDAAETGFTPAMIEKVVRLLQREHRREVSSLRLRAWRVIEPLSQPAPAEREFTERLQEGELVPELLSPADARLADRLRVHPVLIWKAENTRAHRGRRTGAAEEAP